MGTLADLRRVVATAVTAQLVAMAGTAQVATMAAAAQVAAMAATAHVARGLQTPGTAHAKEKAREEPTVKHLRSLLTRALHR